MKRQSIIITLALLMVFGTAFAQMNGKGKNVQMKGQMKGEKCQILTEEEREKVTEVKRDFEKKAIPLRADIKVLKMELDELIIDGKSTDAKLNELNDAKAKLSKEQVKHKAAVRKIVGEEKYKKLEMHKRHMMHGKMKGMHGGKKGGKMQGPRGEGECRYDNAPRNK